jgi:hypothetical protein
MPFKTTLQLTFCIGASFILSTWTVLLTPFTPRASFASTGIEDIEAAHFTLRTCAMMYGVLAGFVYFHWTRIARPRVAAEEMEKSGASKLLDEGFSSGGAFDQYGTELTSIRGMKGGKGGKK